MNGMTLQRELMSPPSTFIILSHEVLGKIGRDGAEWEAMVTVAAAIKERKPFGYG